MRFNAQTAQARAQIAALQSQMQALNRQQALMNAASTRALSNGLKNRVPASMDFNLRGPLGQMDDLTKRIQKGKISQKEFTETIRGTNKMYEYQNQLQRASLNNIQRMGSQRMRTGINLPELQAQSSWLRRNATEWATAGAAAKSYGRQVMDTGKNMAFMGRQAMLSVTAPIALIAAGTAKAFYDADKQLTNLAKVYGDADSNMGASSDSIREAARGLASEMNRQFAIAQKDTLELATAFASLGESGRNLDYMVSAAARLMRLGDVSTESATKMISTLRTVFKLEGDALEDAINMANTFENSTTLTMQDFSDALPKMGSIVQSWGGDIEQAGMLIENFTRSGIPAVEGANALKAAFASLVKPTGTLEKAWTKMLPNYGGSLGDISKEMGGDVNKILAEIGRLQDAADVAPDERKAFAVQLAGKYQLNRIMTLTENAANPTEALKKIQAMSDEELKAFNKATADREVAIQMQSSSAQFKKTINEIQMYAERVGEKVLPMITNALKQIISFGKAMYQGTKEALDMLGPIGDMLAWIAPKALLMAAAFGPLMLMFSSFMLIKGGLITALGAMAALMGKMKGQKGQVLFQTGAQRAADLQAKQMVIQRDAETAATNRLTQAITRLNSTYAGVRNAGTIAATNASRNANTQATAAQRVASATNTQARALNTLTQAQQQAARMGGRLLPMNNITAQTQKNAAAATLAAQRASADKGAYGNNRPAMNSPLTLPARPLQEPTRRQQITSAITNKPANLKPVPINERLLQRYTPSPVALAAQARTEGIKSGRIAADNFGKAFERQLNTGARRPSALVPSGSFVSPGRNSTNAGIASEQDRRIAAGMRQTVQSDFASGRVMSNAQTTTASQARITSRNEAHIAALKENQLRTQTALNQRYSDGAARVGGMATGLGLVATLLSGTNATVQKIGTGLMVMGTLAMVMPGLFGRMAGAIATGGRSLLATIGLTRVATGAAAGLGAAFSAALGPLLALAAAGAVAYGVYRIMTNDAKKLHEENDKIKDSVKGWSETLGYTRKQFGQIKNEATGDWMNTQASLNNNVANDETLKPLIDKMKREAGNLDNLRIMLEQEAIKMYADGANAEQVTQGIEALLNASNIDPVISKELQVQFENVTPTGLNGTSLSESVKKQMNNILGSTEGNTASFWQQGIRDNGGFLGIGGEGDGQTTTSLSQKAKTEIDAMYNQMNYAMANAEPGKGGDVLKNYFAGIQNEISAGVASLPKKAQDAIAANGGSIMNLNLDDLGLNGEQIDKLRYQQTVLADIMNRMREDAGADDSHQWMFDDIGNSAVRMANKTQVAMFDYQGASDALAQAAARMGDAWNKLSDDEKVYMFNQYRMAAGLEMLSPELALAAMKAGEFGNTVLANGQKVDAMAESVAAGEEDVAALNEEFGDGKTADWTAKINIEGMGDMSVEDLVQQRKDQMSAVRDDYMDEMAAEAQIQWDAQKRAFQDAQKAAQDAMAARQDAEKEALDAAAEAEKKAFNNNWDARLEGEKKVYEDRIKAIEDTQEAEDELERMRKRNSDREARRLKYLASLQQIGIDTNIAFAGGDLDEVARLSLNASTAANDYNTENTEAEAGYAKEDADKARSKAIDLIKEEEDAKIASLEKQRVAEEEAMNLRIENQQKELATRQKAEQDYLSRKQEDENIAYEISFQANQRSLNRELEALRTQIPLNEQELQAHMQRVGGAYDSHGTNLMAKGNVWSETIENSLIDHIDNARKQISNDQAWMSYGNSVAEGIAQGGFKMNADQFNNFLRTGEMPAAPKGPGMMPQNTAQGVRHAGGKLGNDRLDNRAGIPMNAPLRSNEVTVLAQKDEYMMRSKAHRKYGTAMLNRVNEGKAVIRHEGGAIDSGKTVARHDGGAIGTEMGAMGAAVMAAGMGAIIAKTALAAGTAMQNAQSAASSGGGGGFDGQVIDVGGANGGYGLRNGAQINYGQGGFPQWVYTLAKSKGVQASTYPGHQEDDRREAGYVPNPGRLNRGIDWSGPIPAMQNFADYLMGIAPSTPTLEQVIWQNPQTGRKSGWAGRSNVSGTGYYSSAYSGHQDHVHTRSNGPIQPGAGVIPGATGGGGGSVPPSDAAKKFPQYAGWTTPGIQAYGAAQMAKFAPMGGGDSAGSNAELGMVQTGNKDFYIREIVDEAKRRGLTKNAAIIALMTAMQESQIRILANPAVPDSYNFPHDGVGTDHDSIGIFQQRVAGWGTTAQRMNARASAGMFYNTLDNFDYNNMDKGRAAQKVQVSQFPEAYSKWEGAATAQANRYFDLGGMANGLGFMQKATLKPERVLSPQQTQSFEKLIPMLGGLTDQGIVKYDVIADVLQRDAQLLLSGVKQSARDTYNNLSDEQKQQINISLAGANITGVDDLERRLEQWADEIIKRIAAEAVAKQRRTAGR